MYTMNSNVFSIDSNVVVSEKTSTRLNNCGLTVLQWKRFLMPRFRNRKDYCSTLPLIRD
jgi:hypothetical protein